VVYSKVQGVENWFTLVVYKTHAEIALENVSGAKFI